MRKLEVAVKFANMFLEDAPWHPIRGEEKAVLKTAAELLKKQVGDGNDIKGKDLVTVGGKPIPDGMSVSTEFEAFKGFALDSDQGQMCFIAVLKDSKTKKDKTMLIIVSVGEPTKGQPPIFLATMEYAGGVSKVTSQVT